MEAIEFLNITLPEHDRTSCSDEDIQNGFYSGSYKEKWMGRCRRCMSLQIINNDEDVPQDVDFNGLL